MTEVQLRPAAPHEHAAILGLMRDAIDHAIAPEHQAETLQNVTANLEAWRRQPASCVHLVATVAGELGGVVLVRDGWNLCSLFVAPRHQRHGLGRQLVQAAMAACRGHSAVGALYLNAAPGAVSFYQRLGFGPRASRQKLPPGFMPMAITLDDHPA